MTKKTNVLVLAIFILLITFEISFTKSVMVNIGLVIWALSFLAYRGKWFGFFGAILLPILPAVGSAWSIYLHGTGATGAWLLFSRTYAFAALGMVFAFGINLEELLRYLEQKKVPTAFVYGILVVIHAVPEIRREIQSLREASQLRGKKLRPWSPMLYLKTIFVAFSWRDTYVEAMTSRGFDENVRRNPYEKLVTPMLSWVVLLLSFLIINVSLFI
ncbi:energy-coupling factor transporter transmembrane component T [Vagococcus sp.]|uniref:energy-coupling factor transporter transmembrane component T n=1 Tax=Vagococcus sp. TaxID=1933889 RepID=UPI003F98B86B